MEGDPKLERLTFFSDAVFAIAITLLVLDLKLPEIPKDIQHANIWELYQPVTNKFFAFLVSFIVIAFFWVRHLGFMDTLLGMDYVLLIWNFVFLFFIVTFPFTTSQIADALHLRFAPPLIIYYINIAGVAASNFMLTRHAFISHPKLTYISEDLRKDLYGKTIFSLLLIVTITTGGIMALLTGNGAYSLGGIFLFYIIVILRSKSSRRQSNKK